MWHSSAQPFFICVFELSTSITSIIFLFDLVHLNDLFCDIVEQVKVKRVLKSSTFVVQKATAPKTGIEFRQKSIGAIRSGLAPSCDVAWRRQINWIQNDIWYFMIFPQTEYSGLV